MSQPKSQPGRQAVLRTFTELFDDYCSESQEVEDRRWTRKENERMRDFYTYIEARLLTGE